MAEGHNSEQLLFRLILAGGYAWPEVPDPLVPRSIELVSIVKLLLCDELPLDDGTPPSGPVRLGAISTQELQEHAWWAGVNWKQIEAGEEPPPFIPQLESDDDDSNFGPVQGRGEPVLDSPEFDSDKWEELEGW